MSSETTPRQPRAFAVPDDESNQQKAEPVSEKPAKPKTKTARKPRAVPPPQIVEPVDDFFEREALEENLPLTPAPVGKRSRLGGWIVALLSILVSVALGLWLENLIATLFDRNTWLGWATLGITALLVLLVIIAIAREIAAIWKLRSITAMRDEAAAALASSDPKALHKAASDLAAHYASDPRTAAGRAALARLKNEVVDGADIYAMAERDLLSGLDAEARDLVMGSARRVSVVTAVSPRALVDIGYVLYENIRLIRAIAVHYGGRSGFFGTITLTRRVVSHLAVTGTVAIGDSIIQQLVGHGVAARLSARLGEGVVNGLMTVRVGLAAIDVCRPAPFSALPQPRVREFLNVLTKFATDAESGDKDGKEAGRKPVS